MDPENRPRTVADHLATGIQKSASRISTSSSQDSGYGSIDAETRPRDVSLNEDESVFERGSPLLLPLVPDQAMPPPTPSSSPPPPDTPVRTFNGLPMLDPSDEQQQRYNTILRAITPALNASLRRRPRLALRTRPRRIDAVRLVVAGDTHETARPYIVFLCTDDVARAIKELLDRPPYQDILRVDGQDNVSFLYETIHGGIRVTFYESQHIVEAPPRGHGLVATNCGTPLRLYPKDSKLWRRATLGGVLEATFATGAIRYYAMTAGHFLDNWEGSSDDSQSQVDNAGPGSESFPSSFKFCPEDPPERGGNPQLAGTPPPGEDKSPWDFGRPKRYTSIVTAWPKRDATTEPLKYFDWALFQFDHGEWRPNALVESESTEPAFICDIDKSISTAGRRVGIMTASLGVLHGIVLAGMAMMAIEPGEEVIDVHVISLLSHNGGASRGISEGDSGSWVVDEETRKLLGHVVAVDMFGDIYVIPIDDTLKDMRNQLKVEHLGLPSAEKSLSRVRERSAPKPRGTKATTLLPLIIKGWEPAVTAAAESSLVERMILLRDLADALHVRLHRETKATEVTGIIAAVRGLRNACRHLLAEVEDPESVLNNPILGASYDRQLDFVIDGTGTSLRALEGMLARLGNDSLLTVRNELGAVASHLATSKVQIDILLDKAQLHHSGSLRTEPSAAGEALDDIKDKVDKIAARIFSRPNSSTDGNIADDLWQMFYDDLLNEGFSKPVLDRNKDVLRAYVRELDSQEFSDGSKTPSEPRFLHTKALSSEASASAKLASKTFGLISTDELVAQDAAEREKRSPYILHLASPSGRYLPNRGMPTSTGITTSARWALPPPYSEGQERRLAPDSQGREIPPSAKWTKIKRSLVSPEVLQRAGVRYEARPEFVAVLGILSKEQILEYSRQSAEIRQRRRHQNARPASKTAPKRIAATSASSHAGSTTEEDPDPWDLDLQAWDSDLDAWNLKRNGSEDSDSGDVSWDDSESDAAEPQRDSAVRSSKVRFSTSPRYIPPQSPEKPGPEVRVGPKPILKFGDLGPSMAGAAVAGLASSSSTGATSDKEREGDTRPSLNLFGSKWRERDRDRDRDRYRDHDRDRDRRRDRDRERDRDRDKDRDERVAQKKQTLKESLGAAGIGGAAATLLSVLADAAVHL